MEEPEFDTESDSSHSPSESPSPSPSMVSPFSSPTPHAFPKAFTSLIDAERATKRLLNEMTKSRQQHTMPPIPSSPFQHPVKKMKVLDVSPQPAWNMADYMNMSQATSALISIFSQVAGPPSTSGLLQNHLLSQSSISSFPPNSSSSSSSFPSSISSSSSPSSSFASSFLRRNEKEKGKENEEAGFPFDINSPEHLDLQLKAQKRLVSFPTKFHSCFQTQEQIEDINYWTSICHQLELHIFNQVFIDQKLKDLETTTLSASNIQEMRDSMLKEGYFHFTSSSSPSSSFASSLATSAEQLTRIVEELREQGWHPMWLLLFDEVWLLAYQVTEMLRRVLNKSLIFNRDSFFTWHMDSERGEAAWEPRRDSPGMRFTSENEPTYNTCWIALTPSSPSTNGAIYLLPATQDPFYNPASISSSTLPSVNSTLESSTSSSPTSAFSSSIPSSSSSSQDLLTTSTDSLGDDSLGFSLLLQNLQAIPMQPGDVTVWSGSTLNYGGRSIGPRVSLSFSTISPSPSPSSSSEFLPHSTSSLPPSLQTPLPPPPSSSSVPEELRGFFPSFQTRLSMISRQLWHRTSLSPRLRRILLHIEKRRENRRSFVISPLPSTILPPVSLTPTLPPPSTPLPLASTPVSVPLPPPSPLATSTLPAVAVCEE